MARGNPTRQQDFVIQEAVITTQLGTEIDISETIVTLDLFENIERPFITGKVLVSDDNALLDNYVDFTGTEILTLKLNCDPSNSRYVILKQFVMTSIRSQAKANDRSGTLMFDLVDVHYFNNYLKKFSRSYTGTPYNIIRKIITDGKLLGILGVKLYKETLEDPIQGEMKLIIPYLTPLGAIEWIRDRCTTKHGSPFFLYSKLLRQEPNALFAQIENDNSSFHWKSLDDILRQTPFNQNSNFVQSNAYAGTSRDDISEFSLVEESEFSNIRNSLDMIQSGAFSSKFTNTNLNTNRKSEVTHKVNTLTSNLSQDNIVNYNKQNFYPLSRKVDEVNISDIPSMYFHQVNSFGTYGDFNSYYDDTDNAYRKRIENVAIRNLLNENKAIVQMRAKAFLLNKRGVGDIATFIFPSNFSTNRTSNIRNATDKNKSGNYMINDIRYSFNVPAGRKISATVGITKLENYT
jgi:hypothetical protein